MGEPLNKIGKVFGKIETGVNTVVESLTGKDLDLSNTETRNQYINFLQAQALTQFMKGSQEEGKRFVRQANLVRNNYKALKKNPMIDHKDYTHYRIMRSDMIVPMDMANIDTSENSTELLKYASKDQAKRYYQERFNGQMALGAAGVSMLAAGHMFFGEDDDQ